ncbi:hypothetical protein [Brevibacterium moorei]|uniref:hypothetical protein n=1 Tax=Brevibacterium moorei TaxID=2968457 RepID=UPI00211BABD6|nr:hypothetical protein [Brevibacterium sp. 68QC2CO]
MGRELYDMLPQQYRTQDALQEPAEPLRRFLDGPGGLLTAVAGVLDDVDAGVWVDPGRANEKVLRWLAQVLGSRDRGLNAADLRKALQARLQDGAPAVGTRSHIGQAAAYVLGEDTKLAVFPDPDIPFTIYVLTDEAHLLAAGGVDAVREKISAYGATPAGFKLMPVAAHATWDSFDGAVADAGGSWDDFARMVRTWADHDSLGAIIQGD